MTGWEIIAGDKRAPVIIGADEKGSFHKDTQNKEMLAWIESLAADIKALKQLEDYSTLTEEQIANIKSTRLFWALICCETDAISPPDTKFNPHDTVPMIPGTGHWELVETDLEMVPYDDIRLTDTRWSQSFNYNAYCPLKTITHYDPRVPAGCVAVAGAQMLYYLHYALDVPVFAPDTAFCNNYIGSYGYVGGNSSSAWDYMLNNAINERGCYSAAVLIADVGQRVGIEYGNYGSGATTSDLVDNVFNYYGISCSYSYYNSTIVTNSISSGMPVVIRADGAVEYILGLIPSYSGGHCFIIDGYKRERLRYTYHYEWYWDEWYGPGPGGPYIPPKTTVSYALPTVSHYRMNWGWGDENNYSYFEKTGNWEIEIDNTIYNFVYQREIIHGFSVIN